MLNLLIAYPYLDKTTEHLVAEGVADGYIRFLLDSGAFTAWRAGKPISLDDYCRFIEALPFKPWRYFMLDVIGDPDATMKNYQAMLARGFNPIPIFTRGDDPSMIDEFYKTSDVIAVGGLVGTKGNRGFVKGIMEHIGSRPVHWLGFTNKTFVKALSPFSCDSSSLVSANRFGQVELFDARVGRWTKIKKTDFVRRPPRATDIILGQYGIKAHQLATKAAWAGGDSVSSYLSFASHLRASLWYEKNIKTKYFLAAVGLVAGPQYLGKLIRIYKDEIKCA